MLLPDSAVVCKLLRTVIDRYAAAFANELIVSRLVCVLETAPSADVVDEDDPIPSVSGHHVLKQFAET